MATRVRSYSKINLGLRIGPVREDGFHGLATLYQTLALHDVVTVAAKRLGETEASRISLTTNHAQVPVDGRNTAWKMVERALARMGVAAEVAIHIEKELPVQGGLGAGSANAAAALLGLEQELGMALPEPTRMELAAEVGSDVPLFLIGGAVLGMGRGEVVSAMPDFRATACVVAVPELGVSTPQAFREWDERQGPGIRDQGSEEQGLGGRVEGVERQGPGIRDQGSSSGGLTSGREPDRLEKLSHVYASVFGALALGIESQPDPSGIVRGRSPEKKQAGSEEASPAVRDARDSGSTSEHGSPRNDLAGEPLLALVRTGIENDFEQVVFPQYPLLCEIKHELMGTSSGSEGSALYAALSGSGSALFGLYRSVADARAAQQRVQASGCKAILTETLPRQEYWRTMFAE